MDYNNVAQDVILRYSFWLPRLVCKPHFVQQGGIRFTPRRVSSLSPVWAIISLGDALPRRSSGPPGTVEETSRLLTARRRYHPCLALLLAGVTWPPALRRAPVVSYTTFSPLPTPRRVRVVCFCGPVRQVDPKGVSPPRMLSDAMLCGVRTFLDPAYAEPRSPDQPEAFSSYPRRKWKSIEKESLR